MSLVSEITRDKTIKILSFIKHKNRDEKSFSIALI